MLRLLCKLSLTGACLVALVAPAADADSWRRAQSKELTSPDGSFSARIDVGSSLGETVGFAGSPRGRRAVATITGPAGEHWSYELLNPIAPVDAVLLDDGDLLTFDNWHNMGFGEVMVRYDAAGEVVWKRQLEDLLAEEVLRRVSRSTSSRWWRQQPLALFWKGEGADRAVVVTLWNADELVVRWRDGHPTYRVRDRPVVESGALKRRAADLARQDRRDEAVALFRQAIQLDRNDVAAYQGLGSVYERDRMYQQAIEVFLEGIAANPVGEIEPSRGGWQSNAELWLLLQLARTYAGAGHDAAAETVFRECLSIDPGFWHAGEGLARLLQRTGRASEADELLERFFEIKRGDPTHFAAGSNLRQASLEISHVYEYVAPEKARDYLERAYDPREPDTFVALRLARVLERTGETDEALEILENLLDVLRRKGKSYDEVWIRHAREAIRRLKAERE